jgi:hypothetical protein
LKNDSEGISQEENTWRYISVEYLSSISGKNLKGITREISSSISGNNLRGSLGKYS